ncbi:unnamed protein product [Toxocara canis]|uniref:Uncharacterized protein n=1 Tax=Toxocara canis TaxID=6265 RepID=A0A3P7H274_TOXCA|nr:unnamed protein product [Toxocara canis]
MADVELARCVSYLIWYPIVIMQGFLFSFADPRRRWIVELTKKFHRSTELDSSFLNRLTLWWFNPIPVLGARKDLEVEDLFQLNEGNTSASLAPRWEALWQPAMQKYNEKKRRLFVEESSVSYRKQLSINDEMKDDNADVTFK